MRHGGGADPDVATEHHRSRPLVDDDARQRVDRDRQRLEPGDQIGQRRAILVRHANDDRARHR